MSVKINLMRMGRKKIPFFRIVAKESGTKRDGRFLENLGYYNPIPHPPLIKMNEERLYYWLKNGAVPSDTVKSILFAKGLLAKWNMAKDEKEFAAMEAKPKAVKKQRKKKRKKPKDEGTPAPAPSEKAEMPQEKPKS